MSRIRANQITNQSADGAPTVQNGLVISGVTTSTTFSGSGASLTNLPAGNLTGTVADARISTLTASKLSGALPAISGANLTNLPAQATIANNADNRIITGGSGVNLNAEANLTWDGSQLTADKGSSNSTVLQLRNDDDTAYSTSAEGHLNTALSLQSTTPGGQNDQSVAIQFNLGLSGQTGSIQEIGAIRTGNGEGALIFRTRNSSSGRVERLRINSKGGVGINTSNFSGQLNNEAGLAVHGSSNDNCRISITTPTKSNSRIGYFGLSNRFGVDVHYGLEIRDAEASYATRLRIDNSGNIKIGETNSGNVAFSLITNGSGMLLSKGTSGNPSNGQTLADIGFNAYSGSQTTSSADALIRGQAAGNFSGSSAPTDLLFFTKPASTGPGSAPTERMRINKDGIVTTPQQPMASTTCATQGTGYLGHSSTLTNQGGHFNTSNSRFVCPVSGYYLVSLMVMTNNSNTTLDIELHKNGSNASNILVPYQAATGGQYNQVSGVCIIDCAANDYLQFHVNSGNIYGGRHSAQCFALLG